MSQDSRNIRIIGAVVAVLVVVGVIALWVSIRRVPSGTVQPPTAPAPTGNPVVGMPDNQLPAAFPPDIPMEGGAPVTSNFNAAAANGQFQATRSFKSTKSVADNFALYQNFFKSNATIWTVISQGNNPGDPNSQSILAKNSRGLMTISMSALPPQPFPGTLVNITYITNPVSVPAAAAP